MEHRAAVDVGRAQELADVPAAIGLVLGLLLGERVGLIGKVPAEDDRVGPEVRTMLAATLAVRVRLKGSRNERRSINWESRLS
jgi:hypothetical protein